MDSNKIKDAINVLKDFFSDDDQSLHALDKMEGKASKKVQEKSMGRERRGGLPDEDMEIPREVRGKENFVMVFSDGACRGNPGPGSYGYLVQDETGEYLGRGSQAFRDTTNNRMELLGAIKGIEWAAKYLHKEGLDGAGIYIFSDSKYLVEGMEKWVPGWKRRGWKKADKKAPENIEMWKELDRLATKLKKLKFYWVKGHAGHPQNEFCDQIANDILDEHL